MLVSHARALALVVGGALFFAAAPALATPNFPGVLKSELGLSYTPPCNVCHDGQPGSGTATTPFAKALLARGLRPGSATTLKSALDTSRVDAVDSDGNGVVDVDQLTSGVDPNNAAVTFVATPAEGQTSAPTGSANEDPRTGCGAHVAPSTVPSGAAFAVAAFVGLAVARRRRR